MATTIHARSRGEFRAACYLNVARLALRGGVGAQPRRAAPGGRRTPGGALSALAAFALAPLLGLGFLVLLPVIGS